MNTYVCKLLDKLFDICFCQKCLSNISVKNYPKNYFVPFVDFFNDNADASAQLADFYANICGLYPHMRPFFERIYTSIENSSKFVETQADRDNSKV